MPGTMAQQDETSLHDELVDTLLPDPAKYLLKRYESRERRHKYHLSVVFFGSSAQVAVDKSWAAQKRLPPTEEVSWDKDKAVYSLRGFHAQHCLRKLHRWVAISYHNGTQLDHYEHVIHCVDALLQDIRCCANDTPMVSPPRTSTSAIWGEGQQRHCRDWNKLKKWAEMHNACYSSFNETQGWKSMFDRYKWCPQDSPYGATMRSMLGLSDDWNSQSPEDIDSLPAYWDIL